MKKPPTKASTGWWRDPDVEPPPKGVKLNLLSKYGIAAYGTFQPDFHIGWDYCMKVVGLLPSCSIVPIRLG